MSTPYKFIQSRADFGKAVAFWFKKGEWPQSITESVAKEVKEWEGGPWASQVSTAINGKLDPKAVFFIAFGIFNDYIHKGDFSKINDINLRNKLTGSKAFTHNNGRPFDGADFFRLFTGLIEVPKKYKAQAQVINKDEISKYGKLITDYFLKVKRHEMLSTKEAWQLFVKQPYSKTIKEEHLNIINDMFRGEAILTEDIIKDFGMTYGKCPVFPPLKTMTKLKIDGELMNTNALIEKYVCSFLGKKQNLRGSKQKAKAE